MNSIKSVISGKYSKKEVKNMDNNMIVKIKKCLDKLEKKTERNNQNGLMRKLYFIEYKKYKIQSDILNLRDMTKEVYLSLNLNQVYQIDIGKNNIVLFLDNDTEIQLSL